MANTKLFFTKDMEGKKFNNLTLLKILDERTKNQEKIGLFRCSCGVEEKKIVHLVVKGVRKSCKKCAYKWQDENSVEKCKKMGLKNRKYPDFCQKCGENGHYAKGMCRNCYSKSLKKIKKSKNNLLK